MPPVRTDRCPHCWAALAPEVGPACPHCRKSLVPAGRKARQAYEQERLARGDRVTPQPPRAERAAPQAPARRSTHPRQPEPPVFAGDPTPLPPPPFSAPAPPGFGDAASAPASGSGEPASAPVWGSPNFVPPAPRSGRRPVATALMVIGALVGVAGGEVAGRAVFDSVFGTKPSHSQTASADRKSVV